RLMDEKAEQASGDVGGAGAVPEDQLDDVVAVPVAAPAEKHLGILIMVPSAEDEIFAVVGPAGEGAGGFLDVVLGVVADAEGEQFKQLAGVVLVGMGFAVLLVVEVVQHGRVARD